MHLSKSQERTLFLKVQSEQQKIADQDTAA